MMPLIKWKMENFYFIDVGDMFHEDLIPFVEEVMKKIHAYLWLVINNKWTRRDCFFIWIVMNKITGIQINLKQVLVLESL